jgi:wyosine [tRNA(Phe)-imidazoG37] synthetase (radical SAM superfamily)
MVSVKHVLHWVTLLLKEHVNVSSVDLEQKSTLIKLDVLSVDQDTFLMVEEHVKNAHQDIFLQILEQMNVFHVDVVMKLFLLKEVYFV